MIHLTGISKQYGQRVLYQDGNFQVRTGDKIGLVGPNGAGKTTIFRIITGEDGVDTGTINIAERKVIGYFSQDVGDMRGVSALEQVKASAGRVSKLAVEIAAMEKTLENSAVNNMSDDDMATLLEKYGDAQTEFEQRGGYDLDSRAKAILTGLGIGPTEYDLPVETFSGGWKMRIALAQILALNPDVLLMDEPTNHLESIIWLEDWLVSFKGALVMTSHDRDFMNRIVTRIVEIANKSITTNSGMLAKEEEFIARFAARASHAAQVQSRVKKLEKIERVEIPSEEKTVSFEFSNPPRSGNEVVQMEKLGKTWPLENGKTKPVFSGASGVVKRLDKIALVGVNGAGKSTLLKIICGTAEPTEGHVNVGASVKLGYFSQHSLDVLNANNTVYEEIYSRVPNATIGFVRNLCGAFLFTGDDVHKKIAVLSGGEKSRVVLATMLANPINFLVLDEPTNHLDIKSRELLLENIQKFDGTVMVVSHDRHFLRQCSNRVFEVDHGALRIYEGNYEYYTSEKAKELK